MLQILNNLPKEYETVIELCEEELTKGTLTLGTLKTRIRTRYQRIVKNKVDLEENFALFYPKTVLRSLQRMWKNRSQRC